MFPFITIRLLFLFALFAFGYYAGSQQWGVAEFSEMFSNLKL